MEHLIPSSIISVRVNSVIHQGFHKLLVTKLVRGGHATISSSHSPKTSVEQSESALSVTNHDDALVNAAQEVFSQTHWSNSKYAHDARGASLQKFSVTRLKPESGAIDTPSWRRTLLLQLKAAIPLFPTRVSASVRMRQPTAATHP